MSQNKLSNEHKKAISNSCIQPFSEILSPLIKESLKEADMATYRKGMILIPTFIVWLVLGMTMRRDLNYYQVIEWMISFYRWSSLCLPAGLLSDGAISHARMRIGVEAFKNLYFKLAAIFRKVTPDFHGYISLVFDGVSLNMPDTKTNTKRFGKHKTNRGSSGFPLMRVVTLMVRETRIHLDMSFACLRGKGTGERSLAEKILRHCTLKNALFLLDAGFFSKKFLKILDGHKYIMKAFSAKFKPINGKIFADGSYLTEWHGITFRVINAHVKGFRPFCIITNLIDPEINALDIIKHYHKRWDIEISYDEIKTHQCATLRGQAPTILRSKKPELIEQELYALLITYNMTRWLIYQSAEKHEVEALELSFLNSLHWIIDAVAQKNCHKYLFYLIANSNIDRPKRNRQNPRVIKVKMSKFKRKRKFDLGKIIDCEKLTEIIPYIEEEAA